jgi:7-cyano-7-deazaguanine synthase in queuosine biosynthesis
MNKRLVLLLLSGGKDSPEALRRLLQNGWEVQAICIDGIQGIEKVGAQKAAEQYQIPLQLVHIPYFDELTWNPIKLIRRDIAMGVVAIKAARKIGAMAIATGVKKKDLQNPKLYWLYGFLALGIGVLKICGLRLLFPAWDYDSQEIGD